jgi:pimeloyl-ACP methyl ester carboxylesterase
MLTIAALTMAGLYLSVCGLLFVAQRRLLYPAPGERAQPVGKGAVVEVPGGTPLLWRDAGTPGPVVVHFHGNGEQVGWLGWLAEAYAAQGVSFAAVEYPGYPGAAGAPSEAAILSAARAALAHLTGPLGVARERLVLEGQSLGSGVAVALAAEGWGRRLVLLTPYTSLPDVAAAAFPFVPARLLLLDRFDSMARAAGVTRPALVVHGTADRVVPFELGRALSAALPRARLLELPGVGHNDVWDAPEAWGQVLAFVQAP